MKEFMGTEEFYSTLESNEYGRKYLDLIRKVQSECRGLGIEEGYERHHIHPKSMGGVKSLEKNGVKLTTFEHCQAHVFLAKAFPCYKTLRMISALSRNQITQVSDLDRVTLEEVYGWSELRKQSVKLHSERLKGHPVSEESTKKRLETRRRRGIKPHSQKGAHWVYRETPEGIIERHLAGEKSYQEYLQQGFLPGSKKRCKR